MKAFYIGATRTAIVLLLWLVLFFGPPLAGAALAYLKAATVLAQAQTMQALGMRPPVGGETPGRCCASKQGRKGWAA